jgi:hypothetical protein
MMATKTRPFKAAFASKNWRRLACKPKRLPPSLLAAGGSRPFLRPTIFKPFGLYFPPASE